VHSTERDWWLYRKMWTKLPGLMLGLFFGVNNEDIVVLEEESVAADGDSSQAAAKMEVVE